MLFFVGAFWKFSSEGSYFWWFCTMLLCFVSIVLTVFWLPLLFFGSPQLGFAALQLFASRPPWLPVSLGSKFGSRSKYRRVARSPSKERRKGSSRKEARKERNKEGSMVVGSFFISFHRFSASFLIGCHHVHHFSSPSCFHDMFSSTVSPSFLIVHRASP